MFFQNKEIFRSYILCTLIIQIKVENPEKSQIKCGGVDWDQENNEIDYRDKIISLHSDCDYLISFFFLKKHDVDEF